MKILIASMARSGSRYLKEFIYSYISKPCLLQSEPFNDINMVKYDQAYVNKIIKECAVNKTVLMKSHINDILRLNAQQQEYFLKNYDWYKILLLRKDLFACTLSHALASTLDNYNTKKYFKTELSIDKTLFLNLLQLKIDNFEKLAEIKNQNKYNKIIYYEDFFFNSKDLHYFNFLLSSSHVNCVYNTKTPNNLINIKNKKKLHHLFLKKIETYSNPLIINQKGFFKII